MLVAGRLRATGDGRLGGRRMMDQSTTSGEISKELLTRFNEPPDSESVSDIAYTYQTTPEIVWRAGRDVVRSVECFLRSSS